MPTEFRRTTLDNGLTILGECDPSAHTAACGFFVKTGARDEAREVMGVSHFLEHMMFKGTGQLTAQDLNRRFDELGARNNAYTSNEMTCFHAQVLPEHMRTATDLLARIMRPALREADFDMEKGVILEEIAMYKDDPFWVLYESCVDKYYAPHPLSHRVLGTTESVSRLTRPQMLRYFEERYSADNTVVALAGNLDFDETAGLIGGLCGSWARTGATRSGVRPVPVRDTLELRDKRVNRAYLLGLCPGPAAADERRYAAAMLAHVLGAPDNSRLHWALIETGLAEKAGAEYDAHDGVGDYYVLAIGEPERAGEIWGVIERELDALINSVTEDDLEGLRNKLATAATLGGERPGDRMQRLGRLWTTLGSYLPLEEELDKLLRVKIDDLRAVNEAFPIRPWTVGRLLPG